MTLTWERVFVPTSTSFVETYPDSRALSLVEAVQISKYPALGTSCDCAFICDPEGWRNDEELGREGIQIALH